MIAIPQNALFLPLHNPSVHIEVLVWINCNKFTDVEFEPGNAEFKTSISLLYCYHNPNLCNLSYNSALMSHSDKSMLYLKAINMEPLSTERAYIV